MLYWDEETRATITFVGYQRHGWDVQQRLQRHPAVGLCALPDGLGGGKQGTPMRYEHKPHPPMQPA